MSDPVYEYVRSLAGMKESGVEFNDNEITFRKTWADSKPLRQMFPTKASLIDDGGYTVWEVKVQDPTQREIQMARIVGVTEEGLPAFATGPVLVSAYPRGRSIAIAYRVNQGFVLSDGAA